MGNFRLKKVVFLLCLIVVFQQVQQAQLYFEPLDLGVGMNLTSSMLRDSKGFLWIGNDGVGLLRYDGYDVEKFKNNSEDSTSISNDGIYSIIEDYVGNIWVGTHNGLNRYSYKSQVFKRFISSSQMGALSHSGVNFIFEDNMHQLWVLTNDGLNKLNADGETFSSYYVGNGLSNRFTSLVQDKEGAYWLAGVANGIFRFQPETGTFEFFEDPHIAKSSNYIKKLMVDVDGTIWMAVNGYGAAIFDPQNHTFKYLPQNFLGTGLNGVFVRAMMEEDQDFILFGIDQGGINRYNKNTGTVDYINDTSVNWGEISSNGIRCLYRDNEGIIWVGSSRGNICFSNPKRIRFKTFTKAKENSVNENTICHNIVGDFFEDSKGKIWIGTDGGGISIYDRSINKFKCLMYDPNVSDGLMSGVIRSVTEDYKGQMYILSWDKGIQKYNPETGKYSKIPLNHSFEEIRNMELFYWNLRLDSKKRFWLTLCNGYIFTFDKDFNLLLETKVDQPYGILSSICTFEDKFGHVFASFMDGIYKFDENKKSFSKVCDIENPISNVIDDEGNFWIGTSNSGVFVANPQGEIEKHIFSENGLSDDFVTSLLRDTNGDIWIATNNGLNHYIVSSGRIIRYFKKDGLQGNQFFFQSGMVMRDGEMYFGGINGFSSFYPEASIKNNLIPPVYVTSVKYRNRSTFDDDNIKEIKGLTFDRDTICLSWRENSLLLRFTAIDFTYPMYNSYAYQLEGFDRSWTQVDAMHRFANYTNLPPGKYSFRVKASNNNGVWNNEGIALSIIISPPLWKRFWFIALCVFVIFLIVFLFIKYREKRLVRDKKLLQVKVKERTEIIDAQKDQLSHQNLELEEQKEELEAQKEELERQRDELTLHRTNLQMLVDLKTKELLIAKNKAEESDRLKSYFLANVSHEIRTPMNAIVGFSVLLRSMEHITNEEKQYIDIINSNSDALLSLVEDILDFSLIEANQMKIILNKFPVVPLMENVVDTFRLNNNKPVDIQLSIQLKDENSTIVSDENRIRQILCNFMSNALKFTDKGYVVLGVEENNNTIRFFVKDTGHGIPENELVSIFGRFVKLEKDQNATVRGIGLGLTISKKLTELLGGLLIVQSKLGEGSSFILELPKISATKNELEESGVGKREPERE